MSLKIFSDNKIEAYWFKGLSPLLEDAEYQLIRGRGQNPEHVDLLVEYDRPDIILTADDEPVLVLEKTREVPTGHNIGQRFARLVRAAELGVPVIKFFPFDAMKHGDYAGVCNLNIRLLEAFEAIQDVHGVPVLAVNWPCDEHHELIDDGSENERVAALVHQYLESGFDPDCPIFDVQRRRNMAEYQRRLSARSSYGKPPPSVKIVSTEKLVAQLGDLDDEVDSDPLLVREETVLYRIGMTPQNCRREDPYTGMQFVYDYTLCRNGETANDKKRNLVLHFPKIERDVWYEKNPNDKSRKSCNWYLTADAFLFSDGLDLIR